ncbi:hypothetical protein DITRI_Ditri20bG0108800 [Diplodiscus trichospermus]
MEMGDQYGLPDLQRFLARRTHFPTTQPQPSEPYLAHRNMAPLAPYHEAFVVSNGMAMPSGMVRFGHDHFLGATATSSIAASASGPCTALFGAEMESGRWSLGNIDGGSSRWPRQETLTLLEIRSRLDSKFKEANQKGPLWDEVSRIMAEEHGYQRSGKKCREKFENLYKYYKKTKDGKAGRQDGKNYRFFRQLEALYGETSNHISSTSETNIAQGALFCQTPNNAMNQEDHHQESLQEQKLSESLSFSNVSEFETSSSENNEDLSAIAFMTKPSKENQKNGGCSSRVKKGRKTKVKDFVESQMKKLIDSQDVWMERMLKTIEDKEQERMSREEEWRRLEAARLDKEHEFWVKERAWFEARDAALMEVLNKFTGKGLEVSSSAEALVTKNQEEINTNRWTQHEISSLIQCRTSLEPRFQGTTGYSKESLWEEIKAKMVTLGYEREAAECKQKWDNMQIYFNLTNAESYKKPKEDFRSNNYFQQLDAFNGQENKTNITVKQRVNQAMDSSASNSYDINSFDIAVNQGDQPFWDRYALKLSKGKNQQI